MFVPQSDGITNQIFARITRKLAFVALEVSIFLPVHSRVRPVFPNVLLFLNFALNLCRQLQIFT